MQTAGFVDGELDPGIGTDPADGDSDNDGLDDGIEVAGGSDPNNPLSYPNIADGDLAPTGNPDGTLNAADYLIAQRIALELITASSLELAHGDMNSDGVINVADLILLMQLIQAQ